MAWTATRSFGRSRLMLGARLVCDSQGLVDSLTSGRTSGSGVRGHALRSRCDTPSPNTGFFALRMPTDARSSRSSGAAWPSRVRWRRGRRPAVLRATTVWRPLSRRSLEIVSCATRARHSIVVRTSSRRVLHRDPRHSPVIIFTLGEVSGADAHETEFVMLKAAGVAFEGTAAELRASRDPHVRAFLS